MPDGERVTTGSEPRRWTLRRCIACGWTTTNGTDTMCPMHAFTGPGQLESIEVVEVVESGHDEQTEAPRGPFGDDFLNRVHEQTRHTVTRPGEWQPDPRTVTAVVEELDRAGAYIPSGRTFEAGRYIENHPRFKPSAPGGDDGH